MTMSKTMTLDELRREVEATIQHAGPEELPHMLAELLLFHVGLRDTANLATGMLVRGPQRRS